MSDNVIITPGVGAIIEAIDEGGGVERQVVTLGSIGDASAETQLSAGQKTSANSIPVVVASDQSALPMSGTVTANAGTNLNTSALALETGGNLATVAFAQGASGTGITQPTGGSGTLGWLSGIYKAVTGTLSLSGTVGVSGSLPAGSNTIGAVDQAGSWSVTANAGTNLNTSTLALETGGNLATLAGTVSAGKIKVDPSGVTSPVSAASLPLPSNAAQETGGNLATLAGAISVSKMQVAVASALPAGTNSIGQVTANAGTNLNTSALALETGGNLATVAAAQGAGGTGITQPTGGSGILGWLSGIYGALTGTLSLSGTVGVSGSLPAGSNTIGAVDQAGAWSVTASAGTNLNTSALALETGGNLATVATAQGAAGTGIAQPTGGSGILGWLSGIYKATTGTLTVAGTVGVSGTVPVSGTFWQTTQPVSGTVTAVGAAAQGSAISGNPVQAAGQARTSEQATISSGDVAEFITDKVGKLINLPYANPENFVSGKASSTGTGATTVIAAQGASVKLYITSLQVGRNDAGTTAIFITLNDSASTVLVVPNMGGGGGNNITLPIPLVVAANTAFTFTSSASTTTIYCNAQGYKGA